MLNWCAELFERISVQNYVFFFASQGETKSTNILFKY